MKAGSRGRLIAAASAACIAAGSAAACSGPEHVAGPAAHSEYTPELVMYWESGRNGRDIHGTYVVPGGAVFAFGWVGQRFEKRVIGEMSAERRGAVLDLYHRYGCGSWAGGYDRTAAYDFRARKTDDVLRDMRKLSPGVQCEGVSFLQCDLDRSYVVTKGMRPPAGWRSLVKALRKGLRSARPPLR